MADAPGGRGPASGPARGVRLGVDVGEVRIGVARSDPDGLIATPVETVQRRPQDAADLARLVEIVCESGAAVVYVGLPRTLAGREGSAAQAVRTYCGALAQAVAPVAVRLVDERLSTVSAHQALHAAGRPGRNHRVVVDQAAAVVILQAAIDAERVSGARVGEAVVGPGTDGGEGEAEPTAAQGQPGDGGTDRMDTTRRGEAAR
ncbi:putative pre-16S rRNA nuclease [Actinotalea fermentans]|uniref:Putative pre-16S rRNA nuclease n=1 Tax=Actinotalea fermentans TaxID=43671 RepID=A0A511YUG9_9CELL|nr:Holliday junction resolvase RuvX [Actinotalea fermentans]GEN78842.1 putative pre-16S rRNA nuclease [Actinotalea fermentans]